MIQRLHFFILWFGAFFLLCSVVLGEELPTILPTIDSPTQGAYDTLGEAGSLMDGAVLTGRNAYIHPFFSLTEYYTDNLFNSDVEEDSDFITSISPGVWASFPASQQHLVQINTLNTAPGGLNVSRFQTPPRRRFQSFALYRADIREHKDFSEEDTVRQRAEGLVLVSLRGGLSLEVLDVYERDEDPFSTGASGRELDKFSSNLFSTMLNYNYSPKLRLRFDYSWYNLDYQSNRNSFRERDDNSFSAYIFHRTLPKTSPFLEWSYNNIDYDENNTDDSTENLVFAGLQMDASSKTRARIKMGIGFKDYDDPGTDNRTDFLVEARVHHRITPKTSLSLGFIRRVNETDVEGADATLVTRFDARYSQKITPKLLFTASPYYYLSSYQGNVIIDFRAGKRKDDFYGLKFALGYSLKRWLNISAGYDFIQRESNFDGFDYKTNTLFLSFTLAI